MLQNAPTFNMNSLSARLLWQTNGFYKLSDKIYFSFVTNYGILMFLASGTRLKFNSSFCTHFMKDAIPLHMVIFNLTPTEFPSVVLVLRV